jgi:hypothetical protein
VLLLQGGEEPVDRVLFRPVAVHPGEDGENHDSDKRGHNLNFAPPGAGNIEGLGIKQGHNAISINNFRKIAIG